jgi:hypothetical protein
VVKSRLRLLGIGVAPLVVALTLIVVATAGGGLKVAAAAPAQVFVGGAVGDMFSLDSVRAGSAPATQVFTPRCSTFELPVGANVDDTKVVYASTNDCNTVIAELNARTGSLIGDFSTTAVGVLALAMDPANANVAYALEFQPGSDFAQLDQLNLSSLTDTTWVTQFPVPAGVAQPQLSTLAISPDGNTVYIGGSASQSAVIYAVPVGGANPPLGAIRQWHPSAASAGVIDLAVNPGGGSLFATISQATATESAGASLYGISTPLPSSGTISGFPVSLPAGATATSLVEAPLTVDPSGLNVYVGSSPSPGAASSLQSYSTANGQSTAPARATGITTNSSGQEGIEGISISPDGSQLIAFGYNANPNGPPGGLLYDVGLPGFTGAAVTQVPNNGSFVTGPENIAVTPEQFSPSANFSVNLAQVGQPTTFTAATPPGSLPGMSFSYSWNFGDGNTATGQSVSDTYATTGPKNVTLVVTPESPAGTPSDTPGQTPYWNGSRAQSTQTVVVPATPVPPPTTPTTGGPGTTPTTTNTRPNSGTTSTTAVPGHKPGTPTLALNPAVGPPGTIVTVTGSGFPKNTPITISWSISTGSIVVTTDSRGNLPPSLLYILTPDILGPRFAVASSTPQVEAPFLVVPSTAEPGGDDGSYLFRTEGL